VRFARQGDGPPRRFAVGWAEAIPSAVAEGPNTGPSPPTRARAGRRTLCTEVATTAITSTAGRDVVVRQLLILMALCLTSCVVPGPARAQDTDADGLPDAVEEALGTDPGFAETPDVIVRDRTKDEGDRVGEDNYAPGLDMVAVALGNVARDRWLWRVDFLEDVAVGNLGLIIYIQADNDETTGRKDMWGVDYMLTCHEGAASVRAFNPDGSSYGLAARAAVLGNSLYLCADLSLHQEEGQTRCSAYVLLETREPYKMVDTVDRFKIAAQGESDREKVRMVQDATESEKVAVTWGLDLMRALRDDRRHVRLPIEECRTHGFKFDEFNEYHRPSVRVQEAAPYTIEATVPRAGRFHPAFIAYDCGGRQVYTLSINGERKGIAVAAEDNNRQALFVLEDALELKQGDVFRVELVNNEGGPRVEDLWLLAAMPETRPLPREVRYLEAAGARDPATGRVLGRVTFVTTWPAQARVEYGPDERYGVVVEEDQPWANHRLWLPDVEPGKTYQYRLTVRTPEGREIVRTGRFDTTERRAQGKVERGEVGLTVRNEHPAAVAAWPVTQGVPFPQGALGDAEHLRLVDAQGREVPLAAEATARWPDGTVKWALLDFQADLPAEGATGYVLQYGSAVTRSAVKAGIEVEDGPEAVLIRAGALQVRLARPNPGYLGQVWLDRNGDGRFDDGELVAGGEGGAARVKLGEQEALSSDAPARVTVLRHNPLHAVVRVEGAVEFPERKAGFGDAYDLHVYLGRPFVRVFHTWTNSNRASEWSDLRSWDVGTTVKVGGQAEVAIGGWDAVVPEAEGPVSLDQVFDNVYHVRARDGVLHEGQRAEGWLDYSGDAAGVTVAVRNLWQLYPKRVTAHLDVDGRQNLTVGMMPEFQPGTYKVSTEGDLEDKLFFYLKDDVYHLRQGVSKRHELLYYFRPGGKARDEAVAVATVFQRPPLAAASPQWYCDSKAWTDVLAASPELGGVYAQYEQGARRALDNYLSLRESGREYGMLNFGDWWGERGRNWGNIEYDTQHAFYLQFIRSGDGGFFYAGEEACRHNMDVDTVWSHADASRVGRVYAHCIGHTGNYYDHKINDQGTPGGGFTVSHTWVEGYLDDYFLTGDPRGMETARLVADNYDSYSLRNYDYDNARTSGWHLILTLAVYRATGDPYYLNAAHIVVERVKEREMPGGGWARQMMPGHCYCTPRHRGEAAFMVGILLTGLKDYHEVTGDERTAAMMVAGAKNIIAETWVPEKNGMRYTSCPKTGASPGLSALVTEGILYAYGLSQDPELGEVALAGTLEGLRGIGGHGKGFGQQTRVTPHFLYQLRQLRLTETAVELGPDGPVTAFIKNAEGKPFQVVLRPWGGAGAGVARLYDPAGELVAETPLDPAEPAAVLAPGDKLAAGVYRIELTGKGAWGLDSYLTPLVLDARRKVTLSARPADQWYFCSAAGVQGLEGGFHPQTVGEVYRAPLEGARPLQTFRVARGKRASLAIPTGSSALAPWSQFWFDPGEPTAHGHLEGGLGPGGKGEVILDAGGSTDPDGRVVAASWTLDGKPLGEGMRLKTRLRDEGLHAIGLRVTDDSGLSGHTAFPVRVPPRWVTDLDASRLIVVEAEDFTAQAGGKVQLFERPGSSGKMLTYWHADLGHTLTWQVEVPTDGDYWVALKYCTGSEKAMRDFKLDGAHPRPELAEFHLPPTGGFSSSEDNWVYLRLGEWTGEPFRVRLSAGRHEVSMTNLGDGCALDQMLLIPAPASG